MNLAPRIGWIAALLAAALAVAGCSSASSGSSRCPADAHGFCPAASPPQLPFGTTINGKYALLSKHGNVPTFEVRPGELLLISVAMTVPPHLRLTPLWFGISSGSRGSGPNGRPVGMTPVLTHDRQPLSAGVHTFKLRWRVPPSRPDATLYLTTQWSSRQPPVAVGRAIAELVPS